MNSNERKKREIIEQLQKKDYRLTGIRKAVIEILVKEKHISINDIILELKKTNKVVNIMSVYNTIDLLMEEHIIHANVFENKQLFYELSDNIIHVVCNICHNIIHVSIDEIKTNDFLNLEKMTNFFEAKKHFYFSHYNFEIHGICSNCQKQIKNV